MGIDAGFDMVPRLSQGVKDTQDWERFINTVKERYKHDAQVEMTSNYIEFKAGEHPCLPYQGHKFLRFSSKISGQTATESGVEGYIEAVAAAAKDHFGSRIRYWNECFDDVGHYDWPEVYESIKSYDKPADSGITTGFTPSLDGTEPDRGPGVYEMLFEVKQISGKGKGLVARREIAAGTRIVCEKPLLTVHSMPGEAALELVLADKLHALTRAEQRQYLSLHNNFPGRPPLGSILKTNGLPCGPGSPIGGVYPTICLINHSCLPNSHNNWNDAAGHETIHATRPIEAGEEITIAYDHGGTSAERRAFLRGAFGFDCRCSNCMLTGTEARDSDARRVRIRRLDDAIGDPYRMAARPEESLRDCHSLLQTLREEFRGHAGAHACRLYYDAFQICIGHGDRARAGALAGRAYQARVLCDGEDSPETGRMKAFSERPGEHMSCGLLSRKWNSTREMVPEGLDEAQFEAWLFRVQR